MAVVAENWQMNRSTIADRTSFIFNNELLSDVNFVVPASGSEIEMKQMIPAHKFVLAISSPVFFAMFYGQMAETKNSIELPDCEYESLLEMFRFLYTDIVNLNGGNVMQVLYLAEKYMVPSLAEKCTKYLQDNLEASNVFCILPHAQKYGDKDLEDRCWKVIEMETEEAVTSDEFATLERSVVETLVKRETLNVKEVELFKAVDRWATKESERQGITPDGEVKRRILGDEIVKAIRFPSMSQKEFASVVFDSYILTLQEVGDLMKYFNGVLASPLPFKQGKRSKDWYRAQFFGAEDVDTSWLKISYAGISMENRLRAARDRGALPTAPRAPRGPVIDSTKIPDGPPFTAFLGNLSYNMDKDDILEFFGNKKITEVRLPKDSNGRPKGFGYAEFEDKESLLAALTLNNEHLKNRRIRVDVAGYAGRGQQQHERECGDRDRRDEPDRTDGDWQSKADPQPDENCYNDRDQYHDDMGLRDLWGPRGYGSSLWDRSGYRGYDDSNLFPKVTITRGRGRATLPDREDRSERPNVSDLERRVDRRVRKKNRGKKRAEPKRDEETPKPCCHLKPREASVNVGVPNKEVAKRILQMPAKFTTAPRVYTSFSSRCRPSVAIVQEAMEELQKNGLGIFKMVGKLKVFYKKSPEMDLQPKLANYGISLEEFTTTYNQEDDRLTSQNKEAIAEQSPFD